MKRGARKYLIYWAVFLLSCPVFAGDIFPYISTGDFRSKTTVTLGKQIAQFVYERNGGSGDFSRPRGFELTADVRSSEVKLFFSEGTLDLILASGEFLNHYQTGSSSGHPFDTGDEEDMKIIQKITTKIEDSIADIRGEPKNSAALKKMNELRPKFAIVDFPEFYQKLTMLDRDEQYLFQDAYKKDQYGRIAAVFNDDVKKRTTLSLRDSGEFDREVRKRKIDLSKYFSALTSKEININPDGLAGSRYIEAQIWGKLSLSNVDYFIVDLEGLDQRKIKKIISKLKLSGRPIYQTLKSNEEWVSRFEYVGKGKVLHLPNGHCDDLLLRTD